MEWRLENTRFRITVQAMGAELSLLWDSERQRNWMWRPLPGVWNNSATQLFPVVGQLIHNGLWQGERFFPLAAHGFLRHQLFTCIEQDDTRLVVEACDTAETREMWPFSWRVRITWQLLPDGIDVTWSIHNSGGEPWGYSSGWHPGFALPITQEAGWSVQFSPACHGPFVTHQRTLSIPEHPLTVAEFPLLPDSFSHGAVYFSPVDNSHWAVCSPDGRPQIVFSGNQPWLALWGVPGADLLCVEPLNGTTDDPHFEGQITNKRGICWLSAGEHHDHRLSVGFPADSEQ
ncbi:aldose epimerase family protein [Kluyvera ascorbata]